MSSQRTIQIKGTPLQLLKIYQWEMPLQLSRDIGAYRLRSFNSLRNIFKILSPREFSRRVVALGPHLL